MKEGKTDSKSSKGNASYHISLVFLFVLWEFKGKMIYVRLSEAN